MVFYIRSWNGESFQKKDIKRLLKTIDGMNPSKLEEFTDSEFETVFQTKHGYTAYTRNARSLMLWRPQDILSRGILREHPVVSDIPRARTRNIRKACLLMAS